MSAQNVIRGFGRVLTKVEWDQKKRNIQENKESRLKYGFVRDDGMVFWSYNKCATDGEVWLTREKFNSYKKKSKDAQMKRYKDNPEKLRESARASYAKNKEKLMAGHKIWVSKNKDLFYAMKRNCENRRRDIVSKTRNPGEFKKIRMFYLFCRLLNRIHDKTMFHVDHILPISKGGRHVLGNIRLTTARFNIQKRDKILESDMSILSPHKI